MTISFALGVLAACQFVMRGIGAIDNFFTNIMFSLGILDPHIQAYILLALAAVLVVLALRVLGGLLGWVLLIFIVLLLVHRLVPGFSAPDSIVPGPLNGAL
jgi:hypothetical protein